MDSNFQYAEAVKLVVALFLAPVAWDRSARRFGVAPCSLAGYVSYSAAVSTIPAAFAIFPTAAWLTPPIFRAT